MDKFWPPSHLGHVIFFRVIDKEEPPIRMVCVLDLKLASLWKMVEWLSSSLVTMEMNLYTMISLQNFWRTCMTRWFTFILLSTHDDLTTNISSWLDLEGKCIFLFCPTPTFHSMYIDMPACQWLFISFVASIISIELSGLTLLSRLSIQFSELSLF